MDLGSEQHWRPLDRGAWLRQLTSLGESRMPTGLARSSTSTGGPDKRTGRQVGIGDCWALVVRLPIHEPRPSTSWIVCANSPVSYRSTSEQKPRAEGTPEAI